ncbi:chitobiase/beta-hexosaminidase C-terminal domain-containing protein [Pendulispora brunnea]|uniref:Chitobiase/beta-hexosaminidase C-terminal domain-containing protein n=1 Tax=Pendulispora brunnea TaxID=2905690 RepID=A0ABZ2KPG2_9BACT
MATSIVAVAGCGGSDGASVLPPDGGQNDGGPKPQPDAGDAGDGDASPPDDTVAIPEFTPAPGTFIGPQDVALHSATAGATIRYTLDGTTPDSTSRIYTAPIGVAKSMTIKAVAQKAGAKDSEVRTGAYVINVFPGNAQPVQFEQGRGTYPNDVEESLSSETTGATICYTMNGRAPSCQFDGAEARCAAGSMAYDKPIHVGATGTQIRAIACKGGLHPSTERDAIYTLAADAPTFDPTPANYNPASPVPVTLATKTNGGEIHYTLDRSEPNCQSALKFVESGTLPTITADTTVKAITCKSNYVTSAIATETYLGETCVGSFDIVETPRLQELSRCKHITGSLTIHGNGIGDISPLGRLESVDGDLTVTGTTATSLNGLEKLAAVGGYLVISGNSGLAQLEALSALQTVGQELFVSKNAIIKWTGPASLRKVGSLKISEEPKLQRLEGFSGLAEILGRLTVAQNASLVAIDAMPALVTLTSGANFDYNSVLESVAGFGSMRSIDGGVSILSNPALTRFQAFSQATRIVGALTIEQNPELAELDLGKLSTIEGPLTLKGDLQALTSLAGLSSLTQAKYLYLEGKFGFTNLHGLEKLTSVDGVVSISGTQGLVDLSGLDNLRDAGTLWIHGNPQLQRLRGLEKLEKITSPRGAGLSVQDNYVLSELGSLDALTDVAGGVGIGNSPKLKRLNGLRKLAKVGGGLVISQADTLASVAELSSLTSVGDVLSILDCNALPNLNGLGAVRSIGHSLTIRNNKSLTRVDDLTQLTDLLGSFTVRENPTLPMCQPTRLADRLRAEGYRGTVDIRDNGGTGSCGEAPLR